MDHWIIAMNKSSPNNKEKTKKKQRKGEPGRQWWQWGQQRWQWWPPWCRTKPLHDQVSEKHLPWNGVTFQTDRDGTKCWIKLPGEELRGMLRIGEGKEFRWQCPRRHLSAGDGSSHWTLLNIFILSCQGAKHPFVNLISIHRALSKFQTMTHPGIILVLFRHYSIFRFHSGIIHSSINVHLRTDHF